MDDILVQTITQWGMAGVMIIAAGYVLYDSWKKNKKNEEWYRERMGVDQAAGSERLEINKSIIAIANQIDQLAEDSETFREEIRSRVETIEKSISKHHPDKHEFESVRMNAVLKIAPTINMLLAKGLEICKVDHMALGLLHNGTTSLSGIPYIKIGVIAEKYNPLKNPQDVDLVTEYRGEDITKYNRLPQCIIQNGAIEFDVDNGLAEVDSITYSKCKIRGIRRIAFVAINDSRGLCNGCVIAYKFTNEPIDMDKLKTKAQVIQELYTDVLESFE